MKEKLDLLNAVLALLTFIGLVVVCILIPIALAVWALR